MIKTKKDLLEYLESDRKNLGCKKNLKNLLFNEIYKFQTLLRKTEYYYNCGSQLRYQILRFRLKRISCKLGFSIPINVFGPGLCIAHIGTIVVSQYAKVGKNCKIHVCVNIGSSAGQKSAPQIGNNVYIAPGAKIFGNIKIADNIAIGANSVVNKSFLEPNITIVGIPAKKIHGSQGSQNAGWNPKI